MYANKIDNLDKKEKFPETYKLLKLTQEEIENLNRSLTGPTRDWTSNQKPPNKEPGPVSLVNFTKHFNINPTQTLPKNCRGRNTPKLIL